MKKHIPNNPNDKISSVIFDKVFKLYRSIESSYKFNEILNDLRLLYKQYLSFSSKKTIDRIHSYKEANFNFNNSAESFTKIMT